MPLNPYFEKYTYQPQQFLLKDLSEELIQIHGLEIYYIPRTESSPDLHFGEDPLSVYNDYNIFEAMVTNVEGWEGQGDIISRFAGLTLTDKVTFTIAQHRWIQERQKHLYSEAGRLLLLEDAEDYTKEPGLLMEESEGFDMQNVPKENDLIWFPLVQKIFVVRFVEHEQMFYPLGVALTYDITCELFDYSSERLDTGFAEVDSIEDMFSTDIYKEALTLEDGTILTTEQGDALLLEEFTYTQESGSEIANSTTLSDHDAFANNQFIEGEADLYQVYDEQDPRQRGRRNY